MGRPLTQCPTACQPLPKQISGAFYSGRPKVQTSGWPQSSVFLRLEEPGHLCLRGKGPSPTFPPSGASLGEEREGAGFSSSPLPPSKLYIKIPIQSSHREKKKKKERKPYPQPCTFNCDRRRHLAGGRWSQENSYKFKFDDGYN